MQRSSSYSIYRKIKNKTSKLRPTKISLIVTVYVHLADFATVKKEEENKNCKERDERRWRTEPSKNEIKIKQKKKKTDLGC